MTLGHPTDNALYYGDCLDWMRQWPNGIVDLIYLDPPFNSNQDFNMLFSPEGGGDAQYRAFADTWVWDTAAAERLETYLGAVMKPAHNGIAGLYRLLGASGMLAYLTYMAERLEECHRLLKPTGSIYLHCDPTASHYLKALMDGIFGHRYFVNEIVWKRLTGGRSDAKRYGRVHDVILYYGPPDRKWNHTYTAHDAGYVDRFYRNEDALGRWQPDNLTASGVRTGSSGKPWRGIDPTAMGNHWRTPTGGGMNDFIISRELIFGWPDAFPTVQSRLEALDKAGLIYWPPKGSMPRLKRYLASTKGVAVSDLIADIGHLSGHAKEKLGYPTQKPQALLERIIKASSNPGDLVLDPFCGCGTTVAAADALGRRWLGIDIDSHAIEVMLQRLGDRTIPTYGIPADYRSAKLLSRDDPFGFETWAIQRAPGFAPNVRQVGDGGIDGRGTLTLKPDDWTSRLAIAQVKGGQKPPVDGLRAFCNVTNRQKAAVGCYITLDPIRSPKAKADAYLGRIHVSGAPYDRMNLWSIHDYFDQRHPHLPPMNNPYTGKPLAQGALF
ncbi:MAG: DNA methyltransferase [bacterium]|nr:DNA methyltransferase [bacterium]MDE0602642.1 DNA methyltransferase [bacterium]